MIGELERRFDQGAITVLRDVEALILQAANGGKVHIPESVATLYKNDIDVDKLKIQLQMLPDLVTHVRKVTKIDTVCQAMEEKRVAQKLLSEVHTLLKLYLTVPATSATSERANSVLKRVKSYLRSTMSQQRMNNCFICHALKERTDKVCLTKIATIFVSANENRLKYFGKF